MPADTRNNEPTRFFRYMPVNPILFQKYFETYGGNFMLISFSAMNAHNGGCCARKKPCRREGDSSNDFPRKG
ncbi:hypothetical protein [Sphingobium yanoikuyae]